MRPCSVAASASRSCGTAAAVVVGATVVGVVVGASVVVDDDVVATVVVVVVSSIVVDALGDDDKEDGADVEVDDPDGEAVVVEGCVIDVVWSHPAMINPAAALADVRRKWRRSTAPT